jgi:hypothetical protein
MMKTKYVQEILAMSLIGDGVLTAVDPERHLKLWRTGPEPFRQFVDTLLRHPRKTRAIGTAALIAGIWWASRLKPQPSR